MKNIIKIIKLSEDLGVLLDGVTETIRHEIKKNKKSDFLSFVSTFNCFNIATSNFFSSKRYEREFENQKKQEFLVSLYPLSNIEITNYFNCEPRFNGNFSRNNLPKIKNGVYTINLDDKKVKKYIVFH